MEITANAIQIVETNNNVLFTETAIPGCSSIVHREGSGLVTLRGIGRQCRARFHVQFGGNIAVPTGQAPGPISLTLGLNGEPLPATTMTVTPGAANSYFNVSNSTFIDVPLGCCTTIAIKNTSTIPVNVQNANLIVERVA